MTGILRAHEAAAWLRHTAQIWQFGIPGTEFAAHPATRTKSAICRSVSVQGTTGLVTLRCRQLMHSAAAMTTGRDPDGPAQWQAPRMPPAN